MHACWIKLFISLKKKKNLTDPKIYHWCKYNYLFIDSEKWS